MENTAMFVDLEDLSPLKDENESRNAISLKEFMATINYEITGGDAYQWRCFGPRARFLDSNDCSFGEERYSLSIIFDTFTQFVYFMEVYDYKNNNAFLWVAPNSRESYLREKREKNVDVSSLYEDMKVYQIEKSSEILNLGKAIFNNEKYDIPEYCLDDEISIDLPEDELLALCMIAHEQDITLNELCNNILREELERLVNEE